MVKLFVIFAKSESTAVIIRRGPSRWHHVIQWDTNRDVFTNGAWFKGRIYEDKCDLSPDGKLFLYFVLQGSRAGTEFTHAWTAISRTPWMHALALWPQGTTYGGGGRFLDSKTLTLRGVFGTTLEDFPLAGLRILRREAPLQVKSNDVPDSDWCGRDQGGQIVFSRSGQLYRRDKKSDKMIADFTNLIPNPEAAPEWATRPL